MIKNINPVSYKLKIENTFTNQIKAVVDWKEKGIIKGHYYIYILQHLTAFYAVMCKHAQFKCPYSDLSGMD